MKNKSIFIFAILIVIINIVTLFMVFNKKIFTKTIINNSNKTSLYKYGDKAPFFELKVDLDNKVNLKILNGKTILLIFFNPEDSRHWEIISYVDILYKMYNKNNLEVFAISKLKDFKKPNIMSNLSLKILHDDEELSVHNTFGLKKCCGATVLIDKKGIIRFITPHISSSKLTEQVIKKQIGD